MSNQKLGDSETNAGVFEAYWFICKPVDDCGEGGLVQCVGFVDFGVGEHEETNDFIIASHAGDHQGSLLVIGSL